MRAFVFMTYNTHLFGGTFPAATQSYADEQRRDRIIALIRQQRPDIMCLCEVWSDHWKDVIYDGLKDIYPFCELHKTSALEMGPGLCVFSHHSIKETCFSEYKDKADYDASAQKGVLGLLFEPTEGPIFRLFFTHMQSGEQYAEIRRKQFDQIIAMGMQWYPDTPAILVGDLNVIANSEEYRWMMDTFCSFQDVGPIPTPSAPAYTSDYEHNCLTKKFGSPPSAKIDYILVHKDRWKIEYVQIINDWRWSGDKAHSCQDCSDHYPILATLKPAG